MGSVLGNMSSSANMTTEEFAAILASYNQATEKLQQSHGDLQREVRRLRDELAYKNRQLERRKRLAALGEMAAGLAHEIRNPLGGIRLYADLLRRDLEGRDEQIEVIDKIVDGVRSLNGLVTEVLALTHTVEPRLAESDLVAIVNTVVELLQGQIAESGVDVTCRAPAKLMVTCDRDMMQRAVLNVMRNAAESAGEGGRVVVDVRRRRGRAVVDVADDGPGIDSEIADRIFNPFFTTKRDGTGLGLAIVHRIVEAHDGSVTVGRSDVGGALFSIKLPVKDNGSREHHRGEGHDEHSDH